jgi:predicted methyltransferase
MRLSLLFLLPVSLAACGPQAAPPTEADMEAETQVQAEAAPAPAAEAAPYNAAALSAAIEGPWRSEEARARDAWRNPAETLEFFEIDPGSTVVEIWPGGGWYTDILAPWIAANNGRYVAAWPPAAPDDEAAQAFQARFLSKFEDPLFGGAELVDFGPASPDLADIRDADTIVTFRNVHSMMRRGFAEPAFAAFYDALAPGGHLGVVTHRQPAGAPQDPRASTGYVQQDYVIALAQEAGFELVASAEINANPADTADHPFGVWTLPPIQRTAAFGEPADPDFDSARFEAIGESDRMTLLFRKPVAPEIAE